MDSRIGQLTLLVALALAGPWSLEAQDRAYVGFVTGVSTLSADGRSVTMPATSAVSLYKPENGAAVTVVGGVALGDFLSLQGNYLWNQNRLTLNSTLSGASPAFYEQARDSTQHGFIADLLLYFRDRGDAVRPYLSGGIGFAHLGSDPLETVAELGLSPPARFSETFPVLRAAVGIDFAFGEQWALRYSFSETLGRNPISAQLSPPGQRNLANFQNLIGLIRYF